MHQYKSSFKFVLKYYFGIINICVPGAGGGVVGMLVVSLRSVNFGFRSHVGCSGQNAIIFSHEGLV